VLLSGKAKSQTSQRVLAATTTRDFDKETLHLGCGLVSSPYRSLKFSSTVFCPGIRAGDRIELDLQKCDGHRDLTGIKAFTANAVSILRPTRSFWWLLAHRRDIFATADQRGLSHPRLRNASAMHH
jgi:hypothetical protein